MEPTEIIRVIIALTAVSATIGYFSLPQHLDSGPASLFKASEAVKTAEVYFTDANGIQPCALTAGGDIWRCSGESWNYVAAVNKNMGGINRGCIWSHPRSNQTLTIKFRNADLSGEIKGVYGILDDSDTEGPAPVNFMVYVDNKMVSSGSARYPGAQEFKADIPAGKRDVEFRVYTVNDKRRHFCFNAWS